VISITRSSQTADKPRDAGL